MPSISKTSIVIAGSVDASLDKAVEKASSKLEHLAKHALEAFVGYESVKWGLEALSNSQQAVFGLENVVGSAAKAKDVFEQLTEHSRDVRLFDKEALETAYQKLAEFGVKLEDIPGVMRTIEDAAAGLFPHNAQEGMNELITGFARMQAAGSASTRDLDKFAKKGVNAWDSLAGAVAGGDKEEARKKVEAGLVDSQTAMVAILEAFEKRFHGSVERQRNSVAALGKAMKASIGDALEALTEGFFEGSGIDRSISGAIDKTKTWIEAAKELGNEFGKAAKIIADAVPIGKDANWWQETKEKLVSLVASPFVGTDKAGNIVNQMRKNFDLKNMGERMQQAMADSIKERNSPHAKAAHDAEEKLAFDKKIKDTQLAKDALTTRLNNMFKPLFESDPTKNPLNKLAEPVQHLVDVFVKAAEGIEEGMAKHAKGLNEEFLDPLTKFKRDASGIAELDARKLLEKGVGASSIASRFRALVAGSNLPSYTPNTAAEYGSREAQEAVMANRQSSKSVPDLLLDLKRQAEEQTRLDQEIVDALKGMQVIPVVGQ